MLAIEVDEQRVLPSLYKEERGAIIFSFDLHGGERVVVVTFAESGRPIRFDCYVAKATAGGNPMLYASTSGRALTAEETSILSESALFKLDTD